MKIIEPHVIHDFYKGVLEGKNVLKSVKKLKDISPIFKEVDDSCLEEIMYEVYVYENGEKNQNGNLYWGLSVLHPVKVKDECNMTRGHFHEDTNCAEIYIGLSGEGLLLLMDAQNKVWAEKIFKNSIHYIDGKYAHRLVNTGEDMLKVGACWPTTSGHDYERVEKNPFPIRIFKRGNELIFEERGD